MSDAAPRAHPLFYERPEVLTAPRHGRAGLRAHDGYAFAARANAIPLNVAEFARAAVCYPIVFAGRETPSPVVITGLRQDQNLFVAPGGAWSADAYVPAYARRYPFILSRPDAQSDQVMLCIDATSPRLIADAAAEAGAHALFEGDGASEASRNALEFCLDFQRQATATEEVVRRLHDAGVLRAQQGKVELPGGETLRLTDFQVVDEAALNALPDAALMALQRSGALAAAYCHLVSLNNWGRLSRLAQARTA